MANIITFPPVSGGGGGGGSIEGVTLAQTTGNGTDVIMSQKARININELYQSTV